ncbi:MAG: hypothetical protein R8M38_01835 [Mariprofundaceae bacterium]
MNEVLLTGCVDQVRQRWMPDGSFAVIASLVVPRPKLGAVRASVESMQPMPIRASGKMAEKLQAYRDRTVSVQGLLRRRYYSRDNRPCWGQVEIWVVKCTLVEDVSSDGNANRNVIE